MGYFPTKICLMGDTVKCFSLCQSLKETLRILSCWRWLSRYEMVKTRVFSENSWLFLTDWYRRINCYEISKIFRSLTGIKRESHEWWNRSEGKRWKVLRTAKENWGNWNFPWNKFSSIWINFGEKKKLMQVSYFKGKAGK